MTDNRCKRRCAEEEEERHSPQQSHQSGIGKEMKRVCNKGFKRNIKTDKKIYINSLAEEAEEAACSGNMKQLHYTRVSGKGRPERPVKEKSGKTINGKQGQLNGWAEHFEELLNRPSLHHLPPRHLAS